jgi:predicted permease
VAQANAAVGTVAKRLEHDYPRTNTGRQMAVVPLKDRLAQNIRPALLMLFGAVGLVLLIACVNVANLLLARAQGRAREVVVRAAVGAARGRLVRQFLVESLMLGAAGAVFGLLLAWWATEALVALGAATIPRLEDIVVDWRVLLFTLTAAVATSLLFGVVPAFAATGLGSTRALAGGGRGTVGHAGTRLRRTLVVAELALAVMLLVGAGLLLRSYERVRGVNPGFRAEGVLTFRIALPEAKYRDGGAASRFIAAYVQRLAATPPVRTAAAVFGLPLDDEFDAFSSFTRRGESDSDNAPSAGMRIITPGYLETMNIPLRAGRAFNDADTDASPEVVLINEEAARRYWPNQNPIGQQIHVGARLTEARSGQKTIVGIVGDVKYGGLDVTAPPEVYLPHTQHPVSEITIAVRSAGDPVALIPTARAVLAALDRELPISAVRPLTDVVSRSMAERRFVMLLLATFAGLAVVLAAIGVYGVLAYLVGQRTQEIGVRLAIGAAPRDVVRLFVREGAALAGVGLGIGLVAALGAARVLSAMLFGITARDPLTFASVAVALAAAASIACYVPARRAARVDPMEALRAE